MRITTRLSTAAESGFISIPTMQYDSDHYSLEDGRIDREEVIRELSQNPGIMFSSDDDDAILSLAVEFLDRMKMSMNRLMNEDGGVKRAVKGEPRSAAERRFDRGKYVFVRVDIRHNSSRYKIKISTANPNNVVGGAECFARAYAVAFADNLVAIRDDLKNDSRHVIVDIVEGEGCEGIVKESEERNERIHLRNKYWDCDRRKCGMCSPINPSCPLYKNGRCDWK